MAVLVPWTIKFRYVEAKYWYREDCSVEWNDNVKASSQSFSHFERQPCWMLFPSPLLYTSACIYFLQIGRIFWNFNYHPWKEVMKVWKMTTIPAMDRKRKAVWTCCDTRVRIFMALSGLCTKLRHGNIALCKNSRMINKNGMGKNNAPNVGLEPTTLRLRVSCSTDWASRAAQEGHKDVIWWSFHLQKGEAVTVRRKVNDGCIAMARSTYNVTRIVPVRRAVSQQNSSINIKYSLW